MTFLLFSAQDAKTVGLKKFRRMARIVASQLNWTKDLGREAEEHMKMFVIPGASQEGEALSFNVAAFKRDVQPSTGISSRVKTLLRKNTWARTRVDLMDIYRVINNLKCFSRYSTYVKKELAKIVMFESFDAGRVVVRQGDVGFSFYFIIEGNVYVEVQEVDPVTMEKANQIIGELGPGDSFGELALLNEDSRRRATIVCKGNVEFLRVDKPDFDSILRHNHENEWTVRTEFFKQLDFFDGWTPSQLNHVTDTSVIEEYNPGSVILVGLEEPSDYVYFILKGRCKVVQAVKLNHGLTFPDISQVVNKMAAPPLTHSPRTTRTRWWHLRTLTAGDYFGVGEGDAAMSVISDKIKVEVIKVRRFVLMKYDRGKLLSVLKEKASKLYPNLEESYSKYLESVQWRQYKKEVVKQAAKTNKKAHSTTLEDVPKILLLESPCLYSR